MKLTLTLKNLLATLVVALIATVPFSVVAQDLTVAKDGTGTHITVQAAIDAAPTNRTTPYVIYIKNGVYKEKISIASNKTFIHLVGESVANTILTHDDYSGKAMPSGGTYGTSNSASVTVSGNDFFAKNITFENTTGDAPQALAINVNSDRAAFKNCRFLGGQDTVLANGDGKRQYFKDCYIDGVVDFIFGSSRAVFEDCIIYAKDRKDNLSGSYITAANTQQGQEHGYVFKNCIIPANRGVTTYVLGRPWQNDGTQTNPAHNKTVFLNTIMSSAVKPEGWAKWTAQTNTDIILYAEYKSKNYDGSLLDVSQRVAWSKQLTDTEAAAYTNSNLFGDWDPCGIESGMCSAQTPDIAVSNFGGTKGSTNTTFRWNISWPIADVKYELFRSDDNSTFTKVGEVPAADAQNINFQLTDALPAAGSKYYYYLQASKDGLATHTTQTVEISRVPTITVTGSLSSFTQYLDGPSSAKIYTLSGINLTDNIAITPPAPFEISTDGTTWHGNTSPVVLTQTNNAVANTTIYVRLNATATGIFSGNISHSSTGANTVNVAAAGEKLSEYPRNSVVLQQWPLTENNQDNASVRSAGVVASVPTFKKLYVSNGTTVPAFPAYSASHGQAFSAAADGSGLWGTASGGPGGNLNRAFFEEFKVTAASGASVRVDSILVTSAFYNTSSNTKLGIVYSKTGFQTADSTNVTGGKGPAGILPSTANGAFATPIILANQNTGTNHRFRVALNDADGVMLEAGETLSIRLYFSCGSSSAGRYGLLKDVEVKGENMSLLSSKLPVSKEQLIAYPNPTEGRLTVVHPAAVKGASIAVYTLLGAKLADFATQSGVTQTTIELNKLVTGNYVVIYSDDKTRIASRIVKQ
ncbi:pectinesterase [Pontibacter aydingkolensis]|uniref:T9SS type A sorting domain-containing protein n=1 Tax=Pontibacter aydingkolensis TaxID=1911536 RepID=A0ABS7CRU6_9BACT|nr:pectinesterase family protein [Pontibacter aydingkolensis]MBW7466515.1 T9SS type A sorting domain-containing protein [Pontibacter aydingkolensis]